MAPKSSISTSEKEILLIEYVESKKFLWDPKEPNYYKTENKHIVYEDCANALGPAFTGNTVKDWWTNLRGTFVANYKKQLTKRGDGVEDVLSRHPTWPLFQRLMFLVPSLKAKPSQANVSMPTEQESSLASDSSFILMEEAEDNPVVNTGVSATSAGNPSGINSNGAKRRLPTDHDFYSKRSRTSPPTSSNSSGLLTEVVNLLQSIASEKPMDRFDNFGAVVAEQLRTNVISLNVELAQLEIQQVLIKYHKDNN